MESFVLGLDFGSDSVRALVVEAGSGHVAGSSVSFYRRWRDGLYCQPSESIYRQHPLDHLESLEEAARAALDEAGPQARLALRGISVDTTASTPCFVDGRARPLALDPAFSEDPDAMFILWKDHSSFREAEEINARARSWGGCDYTRFSGGIYSSEWFWAKALRVARRNARVADSAASLVEHCDWIPALLSGVESPSALRRSRGAAGHKALWHASWGGYPPEAFWEGLDPRLSSLAASLGGGQTLSGGTPIGRLCPEWAGRLGLQTTVVVGSGTVDAHTGAFGAGIKPGLLVQILGTSACGIMIGPLPEGEEVPVRGICGQVEGSVIGGCIGYEAGQSAFGDVLAWYRDLLLWPLEHKLPEGESLMGRSSLFASLEAAAAGLRPGSSGILCLDWFNGRRSPDDDPTRRGALTGLSLGATAPELYRSLIESLAFGSRAIVERLRSEGACIEGVIATGGIARKSPLVMQVLSDVLGMEIGVSAGDQTVALGSAMFAALAAGIQPDPASAQEAMGPGLERSYLPDAGNSALYGELFRRYLELGERIG